VLSELQKFYRLEIEPLLGPPKGASNAEIAQLEKALGFPLPRDYRSFLRWMGKDTDGPLIGSDCFVDDIVDNNRTLVELLSENDVSYRLPTRYVTVFTHQGYMAAWFEMPTAADDPPCAFLTEQTCELQFFDSVTDFFLEELRALLPAVRKTRKHHRWWRLIKRAYNIARARRP